MKVLSSVWKTSVSGGRLTRMNWSKMLDPRILSCCSASSYVLSMCLPAGSNADGLVRGWQLAVCCLFGFLFTYPGPTALVYLSGIVANLLFLFSVVLFFGRVFWQSRRPAYLSIFWVDVFAFVLAAFPLTLGPTPVVFKGMPALLFLDELLWIGSPILLSIAAFRAHTQSLLVQQIEMESEKASGEG